MALLALAAATLLSPARAQQRTAFDVMENRGELLGWEAVGRLDMPGGYCTGALIAPDLVLTAAHCVYDTDRGIPREARDMLFRAGYHHGSEITARRVLRWVVPARYEAIMSRNGPAVSQDAVATDVALLKLEASVSSAEADPFRVHQAPVAGTGVSVASYGRGREEVLSRELDCQMTRKYRGDILGFDCDVTYGSSGAPVFVREDGRLRILSVVSSGTAEGEVYGPSLPPLVAELSGRLSREDARPKVTAGAKRITVGGGTRNSTGARFVRVSP